MNIRLLLAYDGTDYFGWQDVGVGPTPELHLKKALEKILSEKVTLQAASRTDRGVHAKGQVVNFITEKPIDLSKLKKSLNSLLPKDITIWEVDEAPQDFHPTLDATGKEYHYWICNTPIQLPFNRFFSWHWPQPLNIEAMKEAAKILIGEHNFKAFCNAKDNFEYDSHTRTITDISIEEDNGRLCLRITGNSFLYKMVRNIVGTLVYVGSGKLTIDDVERILKNQDRTKAGITAPAQGLVLYRVNYPSDY